MRQAQFAPLKNRANPRENMILPLDVRFKVRLHIAELVKNF
jgi:hypothetical protein